VILRSRTAEGRTTTLRARAFVVPFTVCTALLAGACGGGDGPGLVFDSRPPTTSTTAPTTVPSTTTSTAPPPAQLGPWVDVTSNLAGMPSECGNMTYVTGRPGSEQVIAGVALHGLWANNPGSDTWTPLGEGGPAQILNRAESIVFDPSAPNRYWESGA
jgi:hypothetical protein